MQITLGCPESLIQIHKFCLMILIEFDQAENQHHQAHQDRLDSQCGTPNTIIPTGPGPAIIIARAATTCWTGCIGSCYAGLVNKMQSRSVLASKELPGSELRHCLRHAHFKLR